MYDDDAGHFITFDGGAITLGDKTASRSGTFVFELASDQEPLYDVHAEFSDEQLKFQLYYRVRHNQFNGAGR